MIKELCVGGRVLRYEFERKKIKNINIRIRPDKSVYVSCGLSTDEEAVVSFIRAKADFIFAAMDRRTPPIAEKMLTADKSAVMFSGKAYPVKIIQGSEDGCAPRDGVFYITLKNVSEHAARKALAEWEAVQAEKIVSALACEIYPQYSAYCPAFPQIRYRLMKSRWGSCQPAKRILTFNTLLAETPLACTEYVVHHEFCHFCRPNHSKAFYDELSLRLPDWKQRRRLLKSLTT